MKTILAFRPLNLIIVAIVQYWVYHKFFIDTSLETGLSLQLFPNYLSLFILDTLLICAGGYLINDFFDYETDEANAKLKIRSKGVLFNLYVLCFISSLVVSFIIAYSLSKLLFLVFWFLPTLLLFLYSFRLKSTVLWGNIIVALFVSASFLIFLVAEMDFINSTSVSNSNTYFYIINGVGFIGIFAFLINLIREIVKDIEDEKGDMESRIVTFANKYPLGYSKILLFILSIILMSFIVFYLRYYQEWDNIMALLSLLVPNVLLILLIILMRDRTWAGAISQFIKFYIIIAFTYLLY